MERLIKLSVFVLLLAICIFAFLPSGNSRTYKRMKRATGYTGRSYYRSSYYGSSYYGSSYYGRRYYGTYYGGGSALTIGLVVGSIGLVVLIVGIVLCLKYCKNGKRQSRVTVVQGGANIPPGQPGQPQRQGPPPQWIPQGNAGPPPPYPGQQPLYPMPAPPYSAHAGPAYNQVHPHVPPGPPPAAPPNAVDAAYPPGTGPPAYPPGTGPPPKY